MATQVTGVQISLGAGSPPTTYNVQIGPNGYQGLAISALFDRSTFDADHLTENIRLKKIIGNYGDLASAEFQNAINVNGIRIQGGDFYQIGFTDNIDGSVTIAFSTVIGGAANQTITVDPDALDQDTHDQGVILKNIGAFLRVAGYNDLTTVAGSGIYKGLTAIQAVASHVFWY